MKVRLMVLLGYYNLAAVNLKDSTWFSNTPSNRVTQVTAELRNTVRESQNYSSEFKITSLYNYKIIAMH